MTWAGIAGLAIAQPPVAAPAAAPPTPVTPAPAPGTPAPLSAAQAYSRARAAEAAMAQVKPAATREQLAAGNFTATRIGPDRYAIKVSGTQMTSRTGIEEYLLYRAAQLAIQDKSPWFELVEQRTKGDSIAPVARDPEGPRFSYRLQNWRPQWRVKAPAATTWASWSPYSGRPFPMADGTSGEIEAEAVVVLHKGMMDGANPLAFEAGSVSDFLVYQILPPS